MTWLAFDGDRVVGMTSVLERPLLVGGIERHVAYWTGLFVHPDYRSSFIYPQLLLAMFSGLREAGIHQFYAAVRRQSVAEAHQRMGLRKIGDMAVLAKPLRPALLLAKYRRLIRSNGDGRWLRTVCSVPDALAGLGMRLQRPPVRTPWEAAEIPWDSPEVVDLARLMTRIASGLAAQAWTVETLRGRYATGDARYRLLGVRYRGRLLAATILRVVDRPEGIRAAVIMDLVHEPEATRATRVALAEAEREALAHGCDVMLYLDGLAAADRRLLRRRAYLASPEKYSLLVWMDRGTDAGFFPREIRSWRFAFGDHDTF
jgi:hypothetical protein